MKVQRGEHCQSTVTVELTKQLFIFVSFMD